MLQDLLKAGREARRGIERGIVEFMSRHRAGPSGDRTARAPRRAPRQPTQPPGAKRRGARHFLVRAALGCFIAGLGILGFFALTLPDTSDLTMAQRKPSITLIDDDGKPFATYGDLFGEAVRLKDMPNIFPRR